MTGLARGAFTISLDFELIWGTRDLFGVEGFRRACEVERAEVIDRLLAMFERYEFPATWCVVGHLFLDHCEHTRGDKHPEVVHPRFAWHKDWFSLDPCSNEKDAPLFYGRSLLEKIRACRVPQEIGSHSFSHILFGDAACTHEVAETDIAECTRLAAEAGLSLKSFVFPRNDVGHLDVLKAHGFACYRGPEPAWFYERKLPVALMRLGHLSAVALATEPPVVLPRRTPEGLVDIPGSMVLFPAHGRRRHLPNFIRVRRALKGLRAAARERRVFHLWFHPTNLADEKETMFGALESIFEEARRLRNAGRLDYKTMGALAAEC